MEGLRASLSCQSLSGGQELLLVHGIVPVEHGARFVRGDQHGDPLRHARPDQVARGRASAIVQEAVRDLGPSDTHRAGRSATHGPGRRPVERRAGPQVRRAADDPAPGAGGRRSVTCGPPSSWTGARAVVAKGARVRRRSRRGSRLRIRVRQSPGWLLRRVRRGTRRAREPCAESTGPARCRCSRDHGVDSTPGHRCARTAAGTDRTDLRCRGCRRYDGGSIRRSTRGPRHRDRIRRRAGTSGQKARRSSCDRCAACNIYRSTQEVRARRT